MYNATFKKLLFSLSQLAIHPSISWLFPLTTFSHKKKGPLKRAKSREKIDWWVGESFYPQKEGSSLTLAFLPRNKKEERGNGRERKSDNRVCTKSKLFLGAEGAPDWLKSGRVYSSSYIVHCTVGRSREKGCINNWLNQSLQVGSIHGVFFGGIVPTQRGKQFVVLHVALFA